MSNQKASAVGTLAAGAAVSGVCCGLPLLTSANQLRREFPALAQQVRPFEQVLSDQLINDLVTRASPSFGWRERADGPKQAFERHPGSRLGSEEVRLAVAIALLNTGWTVDRLKGLNIDTLHELASSSRGLRENHVIGAALFDKPVADPTGLAPQPQHDETAPDEATINEFLGSPAGQALLRLLTSLWRDSGRNDGPSTDV